MERSGDFVAIDFETANHRRDSACAVGLVKVVDGEIIVGASSTSGALYGFPNEIDVYALNYNKKLFESAGIKAPPAEQKAAWDFLSWLNGPKSGPNGGSAMGEILVSMGILPSRSSDAAAFADKLKDPFLKAYIDEVPNAEPFPVVLGGQEFSESLQQHVEAVEFGRESAAQAAAAAQADATSILSRAAK